MHYYFCNLVFVYPFPKYKMIKKKNTYIMENLHFKIWTTWIECMFGGIMESDLFDDPSYLMLINGLARLSSPKSLVSFLARIILQSNCINLIDILIKYYFRRSVIWNECKYTLLPVIVCLNCAIIYESDVHWGRSRVVDVAIRKVPVCSIVHIIPLILI